MGSDGAPAVLVDHLWQGYRPGIARRTAHRWALRGVSFTVARGEALGVVGGNGSGKTTLLQTLAGVIAPVRGRAEVRGRAVSLVDLGAGFHRELTGHENLLLGGPLVGLSRREVRERYEEIVAFAGLSEDAMAGELRTFSAGMGLRLGFSLVVHARPDVLLVDEVLAVGDEEFQGRCLARVRELREGGCAVIVVSHDLSLIERETDRAAVLDRGELALVGEPAAAVRRYHELAGGRPDAQDLSHGAVWRATPRRRRRRGIL